MTDLQNLISDIIWNEAEIHNEYGVDPYVSNSDELAEKILILVQQELFRSITMENSND